MYWLLWAAGLDPAQFRGPKDGILRGPSGLIWGDPSWRLGEEYPERMRTRAKESRHCVIIGHQIEVYPSDGGRWGVAVDGQEQVTRYGNSYAAWAVGAAESYRQGRVAGCPPMHD